jgi:CspA family cold shock protein
MASERKTGTVKFFNDKNGYGFIKPDDGGRDVFVHVSALQKASIDVLNEGDRVEFEAEPSQREGKGDKAINLRVLEAKGA